MSLLQPGLRRALTVGWSFAALSCSFDSRPERIVSAEAAVSEEDAGDDSDAGALDLPDAALAADGDAGRARDAGATRPTGTATAPTRPATMTVEPRRDAGTGMDSSAPPPQEPLEGGADAAAHDAGAPSSVNPHCREGNYEGTFNGSLQVIGLSLSTITGTVAAELEMNPAGTYLEMRNAPVMGIDESGNTLTVRLSANINCSTHALTNGELTDGVFHNTAGNSDTAFTGTVEGTYSEDPHSVSGTWTVRATDFAAFFSGRGTWSVVLRD